MFFVKDANAHRLAMKNDGRCSVFCILFLRVEDPSMFFEVVALTERVLPWKQYHIRFTDNSSHVSLCFFLRTRMQESTGRSRFRRDRISS